MVLSLRPARHFDMIKDIIMREVTKRDRKPGLLRPFTVVRKRTPISRE